MRNLIKVIQSKIHRIYDYTTLKIAPALDHDNTRLDTLIKSFPSILNRQIFKQFRDGQPNIIFELYATNEKSFYMYTVPTFHKYLLKEKLQSAFPGAGIKEMNDPPIIDHTNLLIAYLELQEAPYKPIDMSKEANIYKDCLHVTEELKEGESILIQIFIEPVENGWQVELEQSYEEYLCGRKDSYAGSMLQQGGRKFNESISRMARSLADYDEQKETKRKYREIKEFQQKIRQNGFWVSVRMAVQARNYGRRNDLLEGLAGAFKTTNAYNHWQLSPVYRKKSAASSLRSRSLSLFSPRVFLCEDEVKTLIKLPTKDVQTRKLERMTPDEKKIDERLTKNIIPIGRSIEFESKGKIIGFNIENPDTACKGRLIIAPPGAGKTTLITVFKNGAMDIGHGGSVFDIADGSLYQKCIETTPPEKRDRLVLVDFANEKYPHIFNFNSLGRDAETIGAMFAEFFEIFFKTSANHRMNSVLRKASMSVFVNPDHTFLELIKLMRDEEFRRKFLPTLKKENPDLFLWWKTEFPKIAKSEAEMQTILSPILYRLDELQYNKRLGPIFCGRNGKLEIEKWMNEGKWVLYNLSNGVFLDTEQRIMMSFLNYAYWIATLSREKMLQKRMEPIPHHKMYDEPQTYMTATPVIKLSISKSRKYRVSDNFFIQSPSQVIEKDKELWYQILDMAPHVLIGGGLNYENKKLVSKEFHVSEEELHQLDHLEYHWYLKTYVGKQQIPPFIFDGRGLPTSYGDDQALKLRWRNHFAQHTIDDVKKDISARNLDLTVQEYEELLQSYETDTEEEGVLIGEDS